MASVTGNEDGGGDETSVKVAVHVIACEGMENVIAPEPGHAAPPLQPAKIEPVAGVAESVTVTPGAYSPAPVTIPLPVPAVVRATGNEDGDVGLNVAMHVTDEAGMENAVLPEAGQTALPLQPTKVEPELAVADSVTVAPAL